METSISFVICVAVNLNAPTRNISIFQFSATDIPKLQG